MIEKLLECPLPRTLVMRCDSESMKYFRYGRLRWPELAHERVDRGTSKVDSMRTLRDAVPEPALYDLVWRCLDMNPLTRISSRQIVSHPYFASLHPRSRESPPSQPSPDVSRSVSADTWSDSSSVSSSSSSRSRDRSGGAAERERARLLLHVPSSQRTASSASPPSAASSTAAAAAAVSSAAAAAAAAESPADGIDLFEIDGSGPQAYDEDQIREVLSVFTKKQRRGDE